MRRARAGDLFQGLPADYIPAGRFGMRELWRSAVFFAVILIAFLGLFGREQSAADETVDVKAPTPTEDEPALFVG